MKNQYKEPVYSKNVLEMLTVANEFCLFIEKVENYSKEDIYNYIQKICPLLYLKGVLLPEIKVINPSANERFVIEEQWEIIFNELRNKFNPNDEYWYYNNSDISNNDLIKASLAENFADIYQDLKDFIMLYQKNTVDAKENAVFECKKLFETHWGYRLVNAHKTIHHFLFKKNNSDDYSYLFE